MEGIISLYLLPRISSPKSMIEDLEITGAKIVSNLNIYHIYSRLFNYLRLLPEDITQFLNNKDVWINLIKVFQDFLRTDELKYDLKSKFDKFKELISKYYHESKINHDLLNMSFNFEINNLSYFMKINFI